MLAKGLHSTYKGTKGSSTCHVFHSFSIPMTSRVGGDVDGPATFSADFVSYDHNAYPGPCHRWLSIQFREGECVKETQFDNFANGKETFYVVQVNRNTYTASNWGFCA